MKYVKSRDLGCGEEKGLGCGDQPCEACRTQGGPCGPHRLAMFQGGPNSQTYPQPPAADIPPGWQTDLYVGRRKAYPTYPYTDGEERSQGVGPICVAPLMQTVDANGQPVCRLPSVPMPVAAPPPAAAGPSVPLPKGYAALIPGGLGARSSGARAPGVTSFRGKPAGSAGGRRAQDITLWGTGWDSTIQQPACPFPLVVGIDAQGSPVCFLPRRVRGGTAPFPGSGLAGLGSPSAPNQGDMRTAISQLQALLASAPANVSQPILATQTTTGPVNTVAGIMDYYQHSSVSAYYSRDYAMLQAAITQLQGSGVAPAASSQSIGITQMRAAIAQYQQLAQANPGLAQTVGLTASTNGPAQTVNGIVSYYARNSISNYFNRDFAMIQAAIAAMQGGGVTASAPVALPTTPPLTSPSGAPLPTTAPINPATGLPYSIDPNTGIPINPATGIDFPLNASGQAYNPATGLVLLNPSTGLPYTSLAASAVGAGYSTGGGGGGGGDTSGGGYGPLSDGSTPAAPATAPPTGGPAGAFLSGTVTLPVLGPVPTLAAAAAAAFGAWWLFFRKRAA